MVNIALNPRLLNAIARQIDPLSPSAAPLKPMGTLSGGQINQHVVARQGRQKYFIKLNDACRLDMFDAEREALLDLQRQDQLHVPSPIAVGAFENCAFLVLEHQEFTHRGDATALGAGLSALHEIRSDTFGWRRDNTIGTTPQPNPRSRDWPQFWSEQRLGFQLELAARRGFPELLGQATELLHKPGAFFSGYDPAPSLLHGDLWCGNFAYLASGQPSVFDPASYYGDRETDLAMTELFGGFDAEFYDAYRAHWPLDPGYSVRRYYYQLYHVLNHLNLFGAGYLSQARSLIGRLNAELH